MQKITIQQSFPSAFYLEIADNHPMINFGMLQCFNLKMIQKITYQMT